MAETFTYACVEERSVGWEPGAGTSDFVGRFKPLTAPKIFKIHEAEFDGDVTKKLPLLEVFSNSSVAKYESSNCRLLINLMVMGLTDQTLEGLLKGCTTFLKATSMNPKFAELSTQYEFFGTPGETPLRYIETFSDVRALHANLGTCTRM